MKKLGRNIFTVLLLGSILLSTNTQAQSDVSELIKSGPADATKLAQAYLTPLFKGFGTGLNSGWNYTANAKNAGRFDFRVSFTGALIPKEDKTFDVSKLGLSSSLRLADNQNPLAPTVAGSKNPGPLMEVVDSDGDAIERFNLPQGANLPLVPTAQLQATIGLPKGIDLTLRGMPSVKLGEDYGKINMLGGGIKVEVLRLITGKTASKILPFDLAVALGYTEFNYELGLNVPEPSGSQPKDTQQSKDFSNQKVDAKISAINTELILSKKLLVFTPFVSVGYNSSKTKAALKGNYPIVTDARPNLLNPTNPTPLYTTFTNPVDISRNDISGFRGNVGFQLNLAVFRFFAAYSLAEYNAFNAGIGLGIGK